MFKKLKDKLAEEVKSSPQRIQLFAQAAQAAVTSASSSISDITNSDLFSIGDNEGQQSRQSRPHASPTAQQNTFQDISLMQSSAGESMDSSHEISDGQRQRRLSNSSFASDISFRLPSYETPSMYHLQSDMEVSASEADERGFSGGPATLDRVTKEQLYAAYKRTQERYKKYRTQYGDLARHYKLLERENAKARSVLVETQDKALRRISELKEQCTLEQSAKAHLEKALRVEIEEKCMKIEALNTKVQLLQNNIPSDVDNRNDNSNKHATEPENEVQLINLDNENSNKQPNDDSGTEFTSLNKKIEKMEQLLTKYKDLLKTSKEKNSQITTELQILSKELENKNKHIQDLKASEDQLSEAKTKIQELDNLNEELQNKLNTFDFTKTKELSTLEVDLQKANEEIAELRGKAEVFSKREEEYAISLAENKLSIHKELESKEAEIKSLKDNWSTSNNEIQSLKIVLDDYKTKISQLEEEKVKLNNDCVELNNLRNKIGETDAKFLELSKKSQSLEQYKMKADEEYKCLQLQLKQETAEKLAMIDRNLYLESKNTQLSEENTKKNARIGNLESELQVLANNKGSERDLVLKETENIQLLEEMNLWKEKCGKLELEIQEEREELVKLQTEIEKLLTNHELIQTQNAEFRATISNLSLQCVEEQENLLKYKTLVSSIIGKTLTEVRQLRQSIDIMSNETKTNLEIYKQDLISEDVKNFLNNYIGNLLQDIESVTLKYHKLKLDYDNLKTEIATNHTKKSEASNELGMLQKENDNLKIKLQQHELERNRIEDQLEKVSHDYKSSLEKINSLHTENEQLNQSLQENNNMHIKLTEYESENNMIRQTLENTSRDYETALEKIKSLNNEKEELIKTFEEINNLKLKLQEHESEKDIIKEKLEKTSLEYEISLNKIMSLDSENKELSNHIKRLQETSMQIEATLETEKANHLATAEKLKISDMDKQKLNEKVQTMESINTEFIVEIEKLKQHHQNTLDQIKINHEEILRIKDEQVKKAGLEAHHQTYTIEQLEQLNGEKEKLKDKIRALEDDNAKLASEIETLSTEYKSALEKVNDLNIEITNKDNALEKSQQHQISLEKQTAQYLMSSEKAIDLENDKKELTAKLKFIEDKNKLLEDELAKLKVEHKAAEIRVKEVNNMLTIKSNECDVKKLHINELETNIRTLMEDNISLKTETSNFASNIKKLEYEIENIKISHAEIESEKDRLNKIIEELASKEVENIIISKDDKDSQTETNSNYDGNVMIEESAAVLENKWLIEHNKTLSSTSSLNLKKENLEDMYEQYSALRINYDTLKDENRRLQSDIEGLQSYLTKISKENSVLNDKLRELIATSEHNTDSEQLSSDVKELRNEIQIGKEKIIDLQRENSFLIEENLELKDQLQSQNYTKPTESKTISYNDKDIDIMRVKYNDLMQTISQLEKHNVDLEQINKSVTGNMQQLQDKNEKLKLSNEKLERRLDESLVSLRHLHSLQENTELEYLRNILYEYLTGSGTHSVTLAKVLAAIVKFDDMQTQMVLQKEKERQGFLRQLGII